MNGIRLRIHGSPTLPTLIYLPGMHGDWTLVQSFRHAVAGQVRFVEIEYPRTTTWSPVDYAREIEAALIAVNPKVAVEREYGRVPVQLHHATRF